MPMLRAANSSGITTDQDLRLHDAGDGFCLYWRGRPLYPEQSPRLATEKKAQELQLQPATLYLWASPLLGHGFSIVQDLLPDSSHLVLIEAEPALVRLWSTEVLDISGPDPVALAAQRCFERLGDAVLRSIRQVRSISLNGGRLLHAPTYRNFEVACTVELQRFWRNKSTLHFLGKRWIKNILANFQTSTCFTGAMTLVGGVGKPLLVCGAGPDLDAQLPGLSRFRDQISLLCADTALPALLAQNVYPDWVVVLEAQWHNLEDFIQHRRFRGIRFIADISIHHPTLRLLSRSNQVYAVSSRIAPINFWQELAITLPGLPIVPALGSVGVLSLYLALRFFEQPIGLVGMDFAEQPGQTHAKQTMSHARGFLDWSRLQPHSWLTRAKNGDTHPVLDSYADLAREVVAGYSDRVFDLRHTGQDLGLSKTGLESLLSHAPAALNSEDWQPQPFNTRSVLTLIKQRLGEIRHLSAQLIQTRGAKLEVDPNDQAYQRLAELIRQTDIVFMDLPDRVWPPRSYEAIGRVHIRAVELGSIFVGSP